MLHRRGRPADAVPRQDCARIGGSTMTGEQMMRRSGACRYDTHPELHLLCSGTFNHRDSPKSSPEQRPCMCPCHGPDGIDALTAGRTKEAS